MIEVNDAYKDLRFERNERNIAYEYRDKYAEEASEARRNLEKANRELAKIEQPLEESYDKQRILRILVAAGLGAAVGAVAAPAIGIYAGWLEGAVSYCATGAVGGVVGGLAGAGCGEIWDAAYHNRVRQDTIEYFKEMSKK